MKTIIFISNFMGNGGAARVIHTLADGLKKNNKVIIASFPFDGFQYSVIEGVQYYLFKDEHGAYKRICAIRKLLKQNPQSVVIAFEYFIGMQTVLAAIGCKCKVIVSERNDPHILDGHLMKKWMRDFLYGCANVLVCQTDDAKACFSKRVQKRTIVIMNPIKEGLPKWDRENHGKTVINFCRLEKQKNIPILLDAFSIVHDKYKDYSLAIYGDGSEEQHIKKLIREMGLEDCVLVSPSVENIHEIAGKCAMFVSSSDYEGLSNSMLEAMAMGMPVVCTDCPIGGARMVIKNGENGILVPVQNVQALTDAIIKIIENPNAAAEFGDNASNIRNELSLERVLTGWNDIITRM